uniref:hypothetical protein n=1 Tax=Escherichia coli TaxID=562 RepID=UPI000F90AD0D
AALRKALVMRRPPEGLIHHSDRGSQYCSVDYQAGDCQDFRVWAGIMGKEEIPYVPTQRTCDTE